MNNTDLSDKHLICRDCKHEFIFSVEEQEFFQAKALTNVPKRCANCRLLMRTQRQGVPPERTAEVGCTSCSTPTRVPFQPNGHKPVLCNVCFHRQKLEKSLLGESTRKELALV
ncbi:MAG TPA: zinc-ribbon domain-containing protein [Planktothrix sp.]